MRWFLFPSEYCSSSHAVTKQHSGVGCDNGEFQDRKINRVERISLEAFFIQERNKCVHNLETVGAV